MNTNFSTKYQTNKTTVEMFRPKPFLVFVRCYSCWKTLYDMVLSYNICHV